MKDLTQKNSIKDNHLVMPRALSTCPIRRNYSTALLILVTCLLSYSCQSNEKSSGNENGDSSFLQVFEENNISDQAIEKTEPREKDSIAKDIVSDSADPAPAPELEKPRPAIVKPVNSPVFNRFQRKLSLPSAIVSISHDAQNGTIYVAERHRIISLKPDDYRNPETILDAIIYKQTDSGEMPAISVIAHLGDYGLWAGFVNGRVIRLRKNEWELTGGGPQFSKHRVTTIFSVNNTPFVGGKGLYQWDDVYSRYLSVTEAKGYIIQAVSPVRAASIDNRYKSLLLLSKRAAHQIQFPEKEFKTLFTLFKEDAPLASAVELKSTLLVGTRHGILKISKEGVPLKRFAEDIAIKNIVSLSEDEAIILSGDGKLYRSKSEQLSPPLKDLPYSVKHLLQDANGTIWIGLSIEKDQHFLLSIEASDISTLFEQGTIDKSESNDHIKEDFDNACSAFESLLAGKKFSGDIAGIIINRERYVFLKGQQICPSGVGYLSPDGSAAILADNEIVLLRSKNAKSIKIPENIESKNVNALYFEPEGRLFLGSRQSGLYIRDINSIKENWAQIESAPELSRDLVSDILPDDKGNIWVSTRYNGVIDPSDEKGNRAPEAISNYKALHVLTEHGWAHFGSNEGVAGNGVSDIENFNAQILFSTSIGLGEVKHPISNLKYDSRKLKGRHIIETFTSSQRGKLFLGHGYFLSGLSWIDDKGMNFATRESGLFSDRITRVGIDSRNRVWLMDSAGRVGVYSENALNDIKYSLKNQKRKQ